MAKSLVNNQLRLIGGAWRSRLIHFVDTPGLRPTPVRVRETLFNWLHYELIGKNCLDLYAGSGALGFEAASRGARSVIQVESHQQVCQCLKNNAQLLQASQMSVVHADVLNYLAHCDQVFNIVFLDPPFGLNLAITTCQLLEVNGWLATNAKIYVEAERNFDDAGLPNNWRQLKAKFAGQVSYRLYERIGD